MIRLTFSLFLAVIIAVGCGSESSGTPDKQPGNKRKQVRVTKSRQAKLPRVVTVSGTLAAEEEIVLSMKVQGRIQKIFVDLGSPVKQGQPLLQLEPSDFDLRVQQAQAAYQQSRVRLGLNPEGTGGETTINAEETGVVRQARAQLNEAKLTRDRMESLFKEGLVARSEFDNAEAAFQVADARYQDATEEVRNRQGLLLQRRAEFELARKQLSDSMLKSPSNGAVKQRDVSPGQFVAVGDPVLTLVRVHPLRLKLSLPERDAASIRVGQKVQVRVEGDDAVYKGRVARLSPAITADNRTLQAEAEIPNEDGKLRPGSFARAEIITEPEHAAVLVPASSVVTFAGITKVISVEKDRTVEKRIRTGRRSGDQVEVMEGLVAGEPVVLKPGNLVGGEEVTAVWL